MCWFSPSPPATPAHAERTAARLAFARRELGFEPSENCASVSISHLRAESGVISEKGPAGLHLNGALNFINCSAVDAEDLLLHCPAGLTRMASCLTVRNNSATPASSVRIRRCECEVGHEQVGILLINTARAHVEDNILRAAASVSWRSLVENASYRAKLRHHLVSHIAKEKVGPRNVTLTINNATVAFRTHPALSTAWEKIIGTAPGVNSPVRLAATLKTVADKFLLEDGKLPGLRTAIVNTVFGDLAERTTPSGSSGMDVSVSKPRVGRAAHRRNPVRRRAGEIQNAGGIVEYG